MRGAGKGDRRRTPTEIAVAVTDGADPAALRRLEARWIARRAWPELAEFYRALLARASTAEERVDWLTRLAELLETELDDSQGALCAWEEVVRETGDELALREQLRLLSMRGDAAGIRRALDLAVAAARDLGHAARALTSRGELHLRSGDAPLAREDFAAALATAPNYLPALAGLAEADAALGRWESTSAFASALQDAPRRFAGRADLFRRLARLAEPRHESAALALEAWSEVVQEAPEDDEALSRVEKLSHETGDDDTLAGVLEVWLEQVPRGPEARAAWMERVAALDWLGRHEEALAALRRSVQLEPGHREAWLALAERFEAGGRHGQVAWALEQAATSTPDEGERAALWLRLAAFVRERLGEVERAEIFERRGRRLLEGLDDQGELASRLPTELELPAAAPPGEPVRAPAPIDPGPTPSFPTPGPQLFRAQRTTLVERVRAAPLDPSGYRALGDLYRRIDDRDRSALMLEIADALEGETPSEAPAPRLILSATDRAGLRHPALRKEDGELLALVGMAFCRTWRRRGAAPREAFGLESGRGANAAAEALLSAVRTLGLPAPDVRVSAQQGPPFSLLFAAGPLHLLVGRAALERELPDAELRFFAGRALFMQNPDLLVLRTLEHAQIGRGVGVLASVVKGERALSAEASALRDALPPRTLRRAEELLPRIPERLPLQQLADAARHSANRAGLVVCGGVAPALAALRVKKALEGEVMELVRFAASERYFQLRLRCA